jgi:hypothetical protein
MNNHPAAEDDTLLAYNDEEDEVASNDVEDERVVAETQPAQRQQLPIFTSPINGGQRYQLGSTPDRLASSQRAQQQQQPQYPFVNAVRVMGLGGARTTANTVN